MKNSTTTLMRFAREPEDPAATQFTFDSGFVVETYSVSAANFYTLEFAASVAGNTATLSNARLEFWKLS